jgi:hypothetical protein
VADVKYGDTYQDSNDEKRIWVFDGTNWVANERGMYLIRPGIGNLYNCTIASDGAIIPGAVTDFHVNNIFTSRFRRYLVEYHFRFPSTPNPVALNLFRAGAPIGGGAGYSSQRLTSVGGVISSGLTVGGLIDLQGTNSNTTQGRFTLTDPALVGSKTWFGEGGYVAGGTAPATISFSGFHSTDTGVVDGIGGVAGGANYASDSWMKIYGLA